MDFRTSLVQSVKERCNIAELNLAKDEELQNEVTVLRDP